MKVFNCILGIFSILASTYCIFYPGLTFLNVGWIVTIIMGAWGISAIIDYVANHKKGDKPKGEVAVGSLGLVLGIVAAVFSILSMFLPGIRAMLDIAILGMFAGWLIVSGIGSVAVALSARKNGSKGWIVSLILGILVLIGGIYGIFHMLFVAQTLGILIGIMMMTYGFRLILSVFEKN